MTVDLTVETSLIRQAADVLDDASTVLAPSAGGQLSCPLVDDSLGNSALGREVVGAATRRVIQAIDAARRLAEVVTDSAGKLRTVAAAFEAAESAAIAPPR